MSIAPNDCVNPLTAMSCLRVLTATGFVERSGTMTALDIEVMQCLQGTGGCTILAHV